MRKMDIVAFDAKDGFHIGLISFIKGEEFRIEVLEREESTEYCSSEIDNVRQLDWGDKVE